MVSSDAPFGPSDVQSLNDQASIDACHSKAWDEAVSIVRDEVNRYIAELNTSRAEAEAVGNVRKMANCHRMCDTLNELFSRVEAKGKRRREDKGNLSLVV